MAGITVTGTVHQISAAIPLLTFRRIRLKRRAVEVHHVPARHGDTHVERERQGGFHIRLLNRFHPLLEIDIQRVHVGIAHMAVRGVRHGRIQIGTVRTNPFTYRADELRFGVIADTRLLRWRDVSGINRAHRRVNFITPGKRFAAFRGGMTSLTVSGGRHFLTLTDQFCLIIGSKSHSAKGCA
ncbi:hypothetical protein D3C80_1491100 [compost metagenome]